MTPSQANDSKEFLAMQAGWGAARKEKGGREGAGAVKREGEVGNGVCLPGACDRLGGVSVNVKVVSYP